MPTLTAVVSLLFGLSIASERLVEIVKGFIPALAQQNSDPKKEGVRRAVLHLLAVVAGIVTAFLASPMIPKDIAIATGTPGILVLGLLASGGSGLWNAVLTYVAKVKDIKKLDFDERISAARARSVSRL